VVDGDANEISRFVSEQFDYVYSSHCLEHTRNPRTTILDWWKLVKPDGHLFVMIPDEDPYEQGVFPSRFNDSHKATFTISKARSS
jgi:2-polyprenyl-3-methyl-5-hydroxy-6-metoxy-1,4-benzoquinol methylase